MTISEFILNYNLHDSLISVIVLDSTKLSLVVDFCYWMQAEYNETDLETGIISLNFENVTEYDGITGEINNFSILDVTYENDFITFLIYDDYNDISYQLHFNAKSVSIDKPQ